MQYEDFDIESLATYLHLTPTQISRLADRGRLPGRKVGGAWRFSTAEIHHWLEDKIGLSDEEELVHVEDVLERANTHSNDETCLIVDMLPIEAIAIPLVARTRRSVISAMAKLAAQTGLLWETKKMEEAVSAREDLHPTALDNGVALLHPRRPMPGILAEPLLALGRTSQGIPFGGGNLTDIFFLICSTDDRVHLRTLTRLSRVISDGTLLTAIREAESPQAVRELIRNAEEDLPT